MQLAERVGYATPVSLCLGRSALHVGHYHHTVGEQPAVRRWDRHRHGQAVTVEVFEELGLPCEISVASGAKATDREVPVDAHAPHVVGDSASEGFDASDVVTPLLELGDKSFERPAFTRHASYQSSSAGGLAGRGRPPQAAARRAGLEEE